MRLAVVTAALVAAGLATPVLAAPADTAVLLEKFQARLDQLEARNTELEKEVKALKGHNEAIEKGLDSPRFSQYEPELTSRLKAVEKDALDMKKSAKKIDALDGLQVGASLTTVAQRPWGLPRDTQDGTSQLNYRADVTVGLPLDPIGDVEQKIFAHFRMGQGLGLNAPFSNLGHFASAPNAVAFRASGANPDDSVAILGQAWYQASIPLPFGGFKPRSRETLEVTFGKMDIFGFFDQNAAAGDEGRQFLNSIFVHNPMLDAGGQIGVDANGFQPGFVASYYNYYAKPQTWRLSLGVFGTGRGANYQRFFSTPLVIGQAETQVKWMGGLTGNYRIYAWQQGQGTDLNGSTAKHTGFGISADQRFGDGITVFGRYGQITKGSVPFDRALTVGSEFNGSYWNRAGDAIGLAMGWMRASNDYRMAGGTHDLLGNDNDPTAAAPLADNINFNPRGAEKVAELYYRYRLTKQFELSPNFQWIARPAANPNADSVKVFGVRAQLAY
jgi:high affinity Mn2+ porin